MAKQPHAIVVGLGIVGSGIAAALAARGLRVTAIEQFAPLHERGSSHGDTRIYRRVPHEGHPYVRLAELSLEGWRAWNRMAGEALLIECGGIDAGPATAPMVQAAETLCRHYGQPYTLFTGAEFNRQYPLFHLPEDWQVVLQPSSGVVRPDAARGFLHRWARSSGARLFFDTPVLAIEPARSCVRVRTADETLEADFLAIAAGSWLPRLLNEFDLGLELGLIAERRVLAWHLPLATGPVTAPVTTPVTAPVTTPVTAPLMDGRLPVFCLDADGGWYGMPTPDGRLKIGHDKHLRQQIEPGQLAWPPDREDAAFLSRCVRHYFPAFRHEPAEMKSCIYTLAPDHNFVVDRHPSHGNILIFSCCSGHGFKYAPAYGEMAAALIAESDSPELAPFRLDRASRAVTRFGP